MENKKKRKKVTSFVGQSTVKHFSEHSPISDVLGSYTGTPVIQGIPDSEADEMPIQDVDDL